MLFCFVAFSCYKDACVRQNLVFKALFGSVSDYKYFLLPHANKKRPLPVLLDSGLRLYGFVDIDSAFELSISCFPSTFMQSIEKVSKNALPFGYFAPVNSLSNGILSGYFPSVRISLKYLLSRIISSRISCQFAFFLKNTLKIRKFIIAPITGVVMPKASV